MKLLIVFLFFLTAQVNAQTPLVLPNTFTNGEIIDADQINQNFSEIETHVNTNQGHKHLYAIDSNGVELGQLVKANNSIDNSSTILLLTGEGYLYTPTNNSTDNSFSISVYFETPDCTGQQYTPYFQNSLIDALVTKRAYLDENVGKYFILDLGAIQQATITRQSVYGSIRGPSCGLSDGAISVMTRLIEATTENSGIPSTFTPPYSFVYK